MKPSPFYYTILYIILLFLQVTVFGNIALFGYATPFLFLYFIIKLPVTVSPNWVMTIAFVTGLILDMFFSTPGVYSLSSTFVAFMRKPFITLVLQREDEGTSVVPSSKTLGIAPFTVYLLLMILTFATAVFIIQAFSIFNPGKQVLQIFASTLLTYILIIALERISVK